MLAVFSNEANQNDSIQVGLCYKTGICATSSERERTVGGFGKSGIFVEQVSRNRSEEVQELRHLVLDAEEMV